MYTLNENKNTYTLMEKSMINKQENKKQLLASENSF